MVLKLGSIEPPGFDRAVSGVRRRSPVTCNPSLLSVLLGKMWFDKNLENYVRVRCGCNV